MQVGYPDVAVAAPEIVRRQLQRHPLQDLRAVMGPEEVIAEAEETVDRVRRLVPSHR